MSDDVFCATASQQGNLLVPWRFGLRKRRAFTMIELVVVVAIIAILAALAIPPILPILKSRNRNAALPRSRGSKWQFPLFRMKMTHCRMLWLRWDSVQPLTHGAVCTNT
jgi:prepilin-type N-terminal cleavage/methylation domain-containing protein